MVIMFQIVFEGSAFGVEVHMPNCTVIVTKFDLFYVLSWPIVLWKGKNPLYTLTMG